MCGTNSPAAQRRRRKAELARMLKHRPPVSPPSNNDLSQYSISTHPQPHSPLFARLPPEVRYRIFAHVLGNNVIYLTQASRRIAHQHYPLPSSLIDDDNDDEHETIAMDPAPELLLSDEDIPYSSQFHSLSLSLLRTCHAVYSEALPALYGSNVFSFSSPLPLVYLYHRFLLPRSHFALIRHVRLHWTYFVHNGFSSRIYAPYDSNTWARFWEVVAGMELLSLGTQITVWSRGEEDFKPEAPWLRELVQVRGVRKVDVRISSVTGLGLIRQPDLEMALRERWGSAREKK